MNSCSDKNDLKDKIENWAKPGISFLNERKENDSAVKNSQDITFQERNSTLHSFTKRKFLGGQWSQEENTDDCSSESTSKSNGLVPFNHEESTSSTNGVNCSSKQCYSHNNNLVLDKSNLRCSDEKPCCFYMKFPLKVNNNVYPEKNLNMKDGMEDYFQQFSVSDEGNSKEPPPSEKVDLSHNSVRMDSFDTENFHQDERVSYPDQINPLNGEEEDEDEGCIYTYKGDNYEANLSHLLQTCFSCGLPTVERTSVNQNGAISIQRILNGSPRPNPNPESNLYSPEMDFLEMDFDPGSNGDGGDSDCEDNNIVFSVDSKLEENSLEEFSKLSSAETKKTNNIPSELRSLLCQRCELCAFNEQKVNNTTSNLSMKPNSVCNISSFTNSSLDSESTSAKHFDNPCYNEENLNVKIDSDISTNRNIPETTSNMSHLSTNRDCPEKEELPNKDIQENNLNFSEKVACREEFSDGDDADDEGGDDSNSDPPPLETSSFFIPSVNGTSNHCNSSSSNNQKLLQFNSSTKGVKELTFSSQNNCGKSPLKLHEHNFYSVNSVSSCLTNSDKENSFSKSNGDTSSETNNNLGSISAPEISPSKEYSPLEKFTRSVSFHNQLSSPKYENVCFSHTYKDNFLPSVNKFHSSKYNSYDYCSCKVGSCSCKTHSQNTETTNMEACVDRLTHREKSMFNITSSSATTSQDYSLISNYSFNDTTTLTSSEENSTAKSILCSYPHKNVPSKLTKNPHKDPNTVSEDDFEKEESPECRKPHQQIEKVMIWTERQATFRQVSQVGTSACGPTAVINVLSALDHSRSVKTVTSAIKTRLRAENSPLVQYLLSRSNAGTTHDDLIKGIEVISEGAVKGKFFHMFPKRAFQLTRWLTSWINKGGVPLATLNLQVGVPPGQTVPDAWHHQMVFGVGPQGIYLTNPLECVSDSLLSDQLCSDSVLLVRRSDIVSRWDQNDKLIQLSLHPDPRWNEINVLGQVVCVLKEERAPEMLQGRRHMTSHVCIPATYQSGVSIFVRSDNPCLQELLNAPQLPLLDE
ncbi:UNVERIFIED_CONTAM: hypothetical protein RMT77_009980 [Armadillidium vulgare]